MGLIGADKCRDVIYPDLWPIAKVGCEIRQQDVDAKVIMPGWYVRVFAENQEKRWSVLFAVRPPNERDKALKDCDEWLTCVNKWAVERQQPKKK